MERKTSDSFTAEAFARLGKEFTPGENGFAGGDFATDRDRAFTAAEIIFGGFGSQLLLTNDICLKCMLAEYGGEGYSHIFKNMIPLISEYGIPEKYLREVIMRNNPLRMLTGEDSEPRQIMQN